MTITIIVNGAKGRMGQESCRAIEAANSLNLVAKTDREDDLAATIAAHKAQVVIDFTSPNAVYDNIQTILTAGAHPVVGTTGLSAKQIDELTAQCKKLKRGAIIAPNFSISAVLMMKYARDAAQYFEQVEIIELHHNQKLDAPSGTAIRTAELIKETANFSSADNTPARGETQHGVPIHSIRLPGLVSHQAVMFGNKGETLTLRHDGIDRSCFMPGVIMACEKVVELNTLVYGLEQLL